MTANKNLNTPAHGSNVNTWDVPLNANFTMLDSALGGSTNISVVSASGIIALTSTQYIPPNIIFNGALTANVNYQIPASVGGFWSVYNNTSGAFTLQFSSASGGSALTIPQGYRTFVICDGTSTGMQFIFTAPATASAAGSNTQVQFNSSGLLGASSGLTFDGTTLLATAMTTALLSMTGPINGASSSVASASTTPIAAASNYVSITGTTGITAFDTVQAGATRLVTFTGSLTITNNNTSMILPNGKDIVTQAKDNAIFVSLGGGNWVCFAYFPFNGSPITPYLVGVSTKTGSYAALYSDIQQILDFTGSSASTFTFNPTTLGNKWSATIVNNGTANLTVSASSGTIDGLSSYIMYPGEERLMTCDGTNLISFVQHGFSAQFTSSGTFTKPPGYQSFDCEGWGGGASGGVGTTAGGGGGGGGFHEMRRILSSLFSSSNVITIGAGGSAVATGGQTVGNAGGNSSIGSLITWFGGGGGGPGSNIANGGSGAAGGGGDGVGASGGNASGTTAGSVGGGNGGAGGASTSAGASGTGATSNDGGGGGGGGSSNATAGGSGGNARLGGAGGGGGSGNSASASSGGTSFGGGNGGTGGTNAAGGGNGTAPAGGGGGARNVGSSGAGARGEVRIYGVV